MFSGDHLEKAQSIVGRNLKQEGSSIAEIILTHAALRTQFRGSLNQLYLDKESWNSDKSISFIECKLRQLKEMKEKVLKKREEFAVKNSTTQVEHNKFLLDYELKTLKQSIKNFKTSLLERNLALYPTNPKLYQAVKLFPFSNLDSFEHVFVLFKHPELAAQVDLDTLIYILNIYYQDGSKLSADWELMTQIGNELIRKITHHEVAAEDRRVAQATEFFRDGSVNTSHLADAVHNQLELKVIAFKKIYNALRAGQFGVMPKTNFLADKKDLSASELIDKIVNYSQKYSHSRTAKAWRLTKQYYLECCPENTALFKEICVWSSGKSWSFFC